jgi:myo-inositol-1(or 4)-monophosphatase
VNFSKHTATAIQAALAAGQMLLQYKDAKLAVEEKESARDIVTEVDVAAENIILEKLKKEFGDISFISEERGQCQTDNENFWIIDPLDGTTNYVSGLPIYGISIAAVKNAKLHAAAIYLPETKDLYFAERNVGSFKNNRKLKCKNNTLSSSLLSVTFPGKFSDKLSEMSAYKCFSELNSSTRGALRLGSSVYSLANCSDGTVDGVVGFKAKIWDIAAGILINTEAGFATTVSDSDLLKMQLDYLVAPKDLHDQLKDCLQWNL